MSGTRSRCTARMAQHVYKQIQTLELVLPAVTLTYNGPAKSTPVEAKGTSILTQNSGSGGETGDW